MEGGMEDLAGKVAVVTGGASGIGRGLCRRLAAAGLDVVVADIDVGGAEATATEIADGGVRALGVAVDVSDRVSVGALADRAFAEFGAVHVVCNNAGVIVGGNICDATEDDWRWVLGVNLGGVVNGCSVFAPRLIAQGQGGHIVNTASVGGFLAGPGLGIYCTSKFAVVGMTESLRAELAPHGIGVSALCPAAVKTQLVDADRNRPEELARAGGRAEMMRDAIEGGLDPDAVGDCVVRGIRKDSACIFTHPNYREAFEGRFQSVLAEFDA
jgi:NAD(P)-dependent dehydrogenase (short-subunit alcohol dehydrogenase family)